MIRTLNPQVRYIGTDDHISDLFESQYILPEGMAYNSYLISDEKVAIMDTTDDATADAWKENLREALAGRTPDYLVVHHMEPDHSFLIAWALAEYPALKLVCSAMALRMLPQFFEGIALEGRTVTVGEGDVVIMDSTTRYAAPSSSTRPSVHVPPMKVMLRSSSR